MARMRSAAHADTGRLTEQGGSGLGERGVIRTGVAGSNPLRVRIGVSSGLAGNDAEGDGSRMWISSRARVRVSDLILLNVTYCDCG